jgi:cell division septation protein DedD
VGLFADANNARNAMVKLQDAGLPAVSQSVKSSKGPRTRVRVGPFETQAEADRVAEKIRALKLEAAVFKP